MKRLFRTQGLGALVAVAVLGTAIALLGTAGCGGPFVGKPDHLPHGPKKTTPPAEVADTGPAVKWDEDCDAHFTDDPAHAKKSASKAQPALDQGDTAMSQAAAAKDPQIQVNDIIEAINQYKKALVDDNYNPAATYGLAVAYAKVLKKGCSLKMLERLGKLATNPRLAGGESRLGTWLDQVEDETTFKPFKNDAMKAIGR